MSQQQPVYNMEAKNPQNYVITQLDLNIVQLRSRRVLQIKPLVVIQEARTNLQKHKNQSEEGETSLPRKENNQTENVPINNPIIEQPLLSIRPPFPEWLKIDEGVEKQITLLDYNMMDELRNVCIKIPLLQAIKEIPIFAKTIKELSTQISGRKRKDIKIIQLVGKIVDIVMAKTTIQKYLDPGIPIVKIHINGIKIQNTLIDLGATINIMSKQFMGSLGLLNFNTHQHYN